MRDIASILSAMLSFLGLTSPSGALSAGDEAPSITVRDQNGAEVNLADVYAQGPVLVYFYPKADTPGCTAQACSLRDAFPDFANEGLQIIGVSGDTVEGQKKFAEKYSLPFTLLADSDGAAAQAFGVPAVMGIAKRQSFLVIDGKIAWIVESAKTGDHAAEVQSALASLGLGKKP
ncbi:MAG: peroxiredoxin [Chthoniobacterales bacterium]|jgi:peroxiredoxin Q/BCP|nr:peroxiredoxin [Chthoniobacterales bacterium]